MVAEFPHRYKRLRGARRRLEARWSAVRSRLAILVSVSGHARDDPDSLVGWPPRAPARQASLRRAMRRHPGESVDLAWEGWGGSKRGSSAGPEPGWARRSRRRDRHALDPASDPGGEPDDAEEQAVLLRSPSAGGRATAWVRTSRGSVRDAVALLHPLGLRRASIGRDTAERHHSARSPSGRARRSMADGETGGAVEIPSPGPPTAEPERASAAAEPSWVPRAVWRGIWQLIAAVLVTPRGCGPCGRPARWSPT
jgi:hypothetical protein